jgi:hypothetical protein
VTELPEPLSLPVELENCIQEESAAAFHITGSPQLPVVLSVIDCPGGLGCREVAVNDKWAGAVCSTQEVGAVEMAVGVDAGVVEVLTGVGMPAPGVEVPVPVAVISVDVPSPGVARGVCVALRPVAVLAWGESAMPLPVIAAVSIKDMVWP